MKFILYANPQDPIASALRHQIETLLEPAAAFLDRHAEVEQHLRQNGASRPAALFFSATGREDLIFLRSVIEHCWHLRLVVILPERNETLVRMAFDLSPRLVFYAHWDLSLIPLIMKKIYQVHQVQQLIT